MDNTQDFERTISDVLEHLVVPVEITPHRTCFGQIYYEWWVNMKGSHGIAVSFPEAMREALNASLTPPAKRRSA